jgi:protein SON
MNKGKKGGPRGGSNAPIPMANLENKHPVSLLGELASKRKWGAPNYTLVYEQGPAHAKNFIFKVGKGSLSGNNTQFEIQLTLSISPGVSIVQQVQLNGIDYTSPSPSNNKKEAKSSVAKFCLQQLGILPS